MSKYPFETMSVEELTDKMNKSLKSANNNNSDEESIETQADFGYFQQEDNDE